MSEAAIDVVLAVRREYLDNAFAAIVARDGSLDAYLADVVGVTASRRAAIVDRLTEEGL